MDTTPATCSGLPRPGGPIRPFPSAFLAAFRRIIPIYCPSCDRRWALSRPVSRRFPRPCDPDLRLHGMREYAPHDEVDQLWLYRDGYPVERLPGIQ